MHAASLPNPDDSLIILQLLLIFVNAVEGSRVTLRIQRYTLSTSNFL